MFYFIGWLLFSIAVGFFARNGGKSFRRYFLLSMLLSPPVGLLLFLRGR